MGGMESFPVRRWSVKLFVMSSSSDVIVVGLGAMGAASLYQLARAGARVTGVDRYHPPHDLGSTHGETRITRLAVGEGSEYVPLVKRSHILWREIEEEAEVDLFTQCGGLILASPGNEFLEATRAIAKAHRIEHQNLDSAEIGDRFPTFSPSQDTQGYFEPEAGYVSPELAVGAQLELASQAGADLRFGCEVSGFRSSGDGVEVVIKDGERLLADRLLLCLGPWLPELSPGLAHYFAVQRQLLYWFPVERNYEAFSGAPVFIWEMELEKREFSHSLGFYGFPAVDGPGGGVKLATEQAEYTTRPDGRQHPATQEEISEMYERFVKPCLPDLGPEPLRNASCYYTATRSSRFVIAPHPDCAQALVVSACSGHGFKHSAGIGELVAGWACGREVDLTAFDWPTDP